MAATNAASAAALERALRADTPQAQTLIGDGTQITTKAQTGGLSAKGSSLPATTADAVPESVFDIAVLAGLVALPQQDAAQSTESSTSSTTHAGGSEASVAAVVTADNRNSTEIDEAGAAATFSI